MKHLYGEGSNNPFTITQNPICLYGEGSNNPFTITQNPLLIYSDGTHNACFFLMKYPKFSLHHPILLFFCSIIVQSSILTTAFIELMISLFYQISIHYLDYSINCVDDILLHILQEASVLTVQDVNRNPTFTYLQCMNTK